MNNIIIKDILIKEYYGTVSDLMEGLHASEHAFFDKTANWKDIAHNYMQHVIEMQEQCDGTCLMAFDNETAVGFIFGYVEEQDESRIEIYEGLELYVSDGFVLPQYRKQGIYKQMNELLEQKCLQKDIKRITRFTLSNNEPMKSFLAIAGYRPTRILYEKWL